MKKPESVNALTTLGRVRLSDHFFMREMLYSEIANLHGMPNIPDYPDLAIEAGANLCRKVLEPIFSAFGGVTVRSAYRSPSINHFGNEHGYSCASNESNYAAHIWDYRRDGFLGATATTVVPAYLDYFEKHGDYRPLAWWIHDHIPEHAGMYFFPKLCAFNISWFEGSSDRSIMSYIPPKGILTKRGLDNFAGDHSALYADLVKEGIVNE
jgi:hypothetical protein